MRFLLLAGLSLIFFGESLCLQAQPVWQTWNMANSALPDNSVKALVADNTGIIWVGTENGLARFDGTNFTVYNTSNSALPNNSIRALAIYGNEVWVGTFSGGLAKLQGNSLTVYNTSNSGLPENQIRAITIGPQGEKWIGTTGGLAKFYDGNWTTWNMSNSGFSSNNITAIALAADESRYLGTINGGLLHQTDSTLQIFNYLNSSLPDNSALSLAFTPDGKLLIGTTTAGLVAHFADSVFTTYSPANSGNLTFSVPALATDSADNWFLGSPTAGLIKQQAGNWLNFNPQNSSLPAGNIQALLVRQTGELWIGTQTGGLTKLTYAPLAIPGEITVIAGRLFPNPIIAGQVLHFSHTLHYPCISIQNSTGRTVLEQKYIGEINQLENLHFPAGFYLVTISTAEGVFRQKLVVQ